MKGIDDKQDVTIQLRLRYFETAFTCTSTYLAHCSVATINSNTTLLSHRIARALIDNGWQEWNKHLFAVTIARVSEVHPPEGASTRLNANNVPERLGVAYWPCMCPAKTILNELKTSLLQQCCYQHPWREIISIYVRIDIQPLPLVRVYT